MSALKGIRVLDLSRVLAGPLCAQLLADNGAEVIKIESPQGDENRRWPPMANGESPNFHSVNRGKEFVSLDLKQEAGREILYKLVKTADVVVVNFLPERARKLKVDYDTLKAVNEDLIYVSITGYGARGQMTDRPGYDTMVNAFCGIMSLTGESDRPPVRSGVSALDMTTGMLAYGAVTTALYARSSGKARGQKIDLSLLESGVGLLGYHATNWTMANFLSKREGSRNTRLVPYGPYKCKNDELIMIGAPNDQAWRRLLRALDRPELDEDPRYCSLQQRCKHEPEVRQELEAILAEHSSEHWFDILDAAGIACSPINTIDTVLDHPQVIANGMIVETERRDGGVQKMLGVPFKLSETPPTYGKAAAPVGTDSQTVLQRLLGMTPDEIARLRQENVVFGGGAP